MRALVLFAASAVLLASCGRADSPQISESRTAGSERTILALGDSLTAGLGVPPESSYPAQLEAKLRSEGFRYRVTNAGVSGETSAGLLERLDWALEGQTADLVLLCIGANDGLQTLPTDDLERNLRAAVSKIRSSGKKVVLVGMRMPFNLGPDYVRDFRAVYERVAESEDIPFLPFLLEGVARNPELNQGDGIHPNARGYAVVTETVFEFLRKEGLLVE